MDFVLSSQPAFEEEQVKEKTVATHFLKVALAIAGMLLGHYLFALGFSYLFRAVAPRLYNSDFGIFLCDSVPLYLIVMPVCAYFLRKPEQAVPERKNIGAGRYTVLICIGMFLMVAGIFIGNFFDIFFTAVNGVAPTSANDILEDPQNLLVNLLFVGLAGPICEELFFRKCIIDSTRTWGEGIAILFSAVSFGLAHGNFNQFFYALGLGLIFGYIYCKTGNILLTVIPHIILNSCSTLLSYFVLPEYSKILENSEQMLEMSDAELLRMLAESLPVLLPLLAYSAILYGGAFVGFIFFLLNYKKIRLERKNRLLLPENGTRPCELTTRVALGIAIKNPGVIALLVLSFFFFIRSLQILPIP